jgi:hypothetical protein
MRERGVRGVSNCICNSLLGIAFERYDVEFIMEIPVKRKELKLFPSHTHLSASIALVCSFQLFVTKSICKSGKINASVCQGVTFDSGIIPVLFIPTFGGALSPRSSPGIVLIHFRCGEVLSG